MKCPECKGEHVRSRMKIAAGVRLCDDCINTLLAVSKVGYLVTGYPKVYAKPSGGYYIAVDNPMKSDDDHNIGGTKDG